MDRKNDALFTIGIVLFIIALICWFLIGITACEAGVSGSERPLEERIAVQTGGSFLVTTMGIVIWDKTNEVKSWDNHNAGVFTVGTCVMIYSMVHNQHVDGAGIHHYETDDILLDLLGVGLGCLVSTDYFRLEVQRDELRAKLTIGLD